MNEVDNPYLERAKRLAQRVPLIDQEISQHRATIKELHQRVRALRREKRQIEAQATQALYDPQMELGDLRDLGPSAADSMLELSPDERKALAGKQRQSRSKTRR